MTGKYDLRKGIYYTLISWLIFTIMTAIIKFTSQIASIPMILFFQNLISFFFVLPWVAKYGTSSLKTKKFGLIFFRSFTGLIGFALLFLAVQKISLVNAVLLNNSAPIFIPFLAYFWLKTPFEHKLWPGILIGFLGILIILRPTKEIFDFASLYALGAAIAIGYAMIALRVLTFTEKAHTVLFYYFLISTLVTVPLALIYWEPLTLNSSLQLLAIGLCSGLGQYFFSKSFEHANPTELGVFCYAAVLYSGIIEWLVWDTIPSLISFIGVVLVCIGGILTIIYTKRPKGQLFKD